MNSKPGPDTVPCDENINPSSGTAPRLILRRGRPEEDQAERQFLDVISYTAATLSHEINNPLLSILASVEVLLASEENLTPAVGEKIRRIGAEAERIKDVIETLIDIEHLHLRRTEAGRFIELQKKSRTLVGNDE